MKRYAFARLEYGANKVIAECGPCTFEHALENFRATCGSNLMLNDRGYAKVNNVSFCIAEYYEAISSNMP